MHSIIDTYPYDDLLEVSSGSSNRPCTILSALSESRAAITHDTLISLEPCEIISMLIFPSASTLESGTGAPDQPSFIERVLCGSPPNSREHASGNTNEILHLLPNHRQYSHFMQDVYLSYRQTSVLLSAFIKVICKKETAPLPPCAAHSPPCQEVAAASIHS